MHLQFNRARKIFQKLLKILLDTIKGLSMRHTYQTDIHLKLQRSTSKELVGGSKASVFSNEKFFCKTNEIILLLVQFYQI